MFPCDSKLPLTGGYYRLPSRQLLQRPLSLLYDKVPAQTLFTQKLFAIYDLQFPGFNFVFLVCFSFSCLIFHFSRYDDIDKDDDINGGNVDNANDDDEKKDRVLLVRSNW